MKEITKTETLSSRFIHGVGFDLRTLLNGFAGPLQLMKYKVDDPDLAEVFRMFDSSLARLERLAIRSSIISRMENNRSSHIESINIIDVAKYSALEMQTLTELENVSLNFMDDIQSIHINGDHDLLLQVFQVLFELIISLSAENSTITIEFAETESNASCTITSPTATLPKELNMNDDSEVPLDILSWDMILAKKILLLQNATVNVLENQGVYNKLEILFEK